MLAQSVGIFLEKYGTYMGGHGRIGPLNPPVVIKVPVEFFLMSFIFSGVFIDDTWLADNAHTVQMPIG